MFASRKLISQNPSVLSKVAQVLPALVVLYNAVFPARYPVLISIKYTLLILCSEGFGTIVQFKPSLVYLKTVP